jgi:hypothetical protein
MMSLGLPTQIVSSAVAEKMFSCFPRMKLRLHLLHRDHFINGDLV